MSNSEKKTKDYFFLEGKLLWPKLRKLNSFGKYSTTFSLTDTSAELLKSKGMEVNEEEDEKYLGKENDRGNYINLNQPPSFVDKDTNEEITLPPPLVIDGKKNPLSDDVINTIGNGSEALVKVSIREWKSKGGKRGKSLSLAAIQLKTLIPYTSAPITDDFPEGSFQLSSESLEEDQSNLTSDDGFPF